ncbi:MULTISPECIES: hypothetical protein [Psychrobacter]|uniref:hypothetical protein n=1 Tax=Psychrobacter TaxID=497 RepID=UPI00106799FE|nr:MULTISPECIES: hypothetical protein [Psychrobacter]TEW81747.1 hypothetical protein E2545_12535 [Psychrobacter sp. 230]|tara:strand:- start:465 stop:2141 length:1677 start_codon:yes stop_codon:yes gene_type:complete
MSELAQFPSQGDLLKFIYNATGIIPSKKKFIIDIDVDDKSLHKSLDRLAKEEGDFLKNSEQYISEFRSAIYGLFTNAMYSGTLYDPLVELFQIYTQTVLTEHTHLGKKESLYYLISKVFLYRATLSVFKYKQYYSAFFDTPISSTNTFWYLEYKDTTPLSTIIEWIYTCENKSQEEFHNTINNGGNKEFDQIEKDLANVKNWASATVKLPPFPNILDVFDRAFRFHNIDEDRKQKYRFFLLIARFSTYCLKKMYDNYKEEEVTDLLNKLRGYFKSINTDFQIIFSAVNNDKSYQAINAELQETTDKGWFKVTLIDQFFNNCIKSEEFIAKGLMWAQSRYLEVHSADNNQNPDKDIYKVQQDLLNLLKSNNDAPSFIIEFFQGIIVEPNIKDYMKNIANCIDGYEILKQKSGYQNWLNEYQEVGNDIVFPWLKHWIDGLNFYYDKEFEQSLVAMKQAFETIRYSAGNRQIKFIEDYMLVALSQPNKNGNLQGWKDFKLAFKWGVFMNNFGAFPDFYSDKSDEELKTMFKKNKKAFKSCSTSIMDTRLLAKLLFHWKYDT